MVATQRAISQLPASSTRSARSSSRYDRTRSRAVSITTPDDPVAASAASSPGRLAKAPSLAGHASTSIRGCGASLPLDAFYHVDQHLGRAQIALADLSTIG